MALLAKSHYRFFVRHPLQLALAVFGITIGVAAAVAVDLSVSSARLAFQISMQALLGSTTHQLMGLGRNVDEAIYPALHREFPEISMRPVVESLVEMNGEVFRLTGFDLFAASAHERAMRYGGVPALLPTLVLQPATILMSKVSAQRSGVKPGQWLDLRIAGVDRRVRILGSIEGDGSAQAGLEGVLLADIATVQELTGKVGRLDRIDLVLSDDDSVLARFRQRLPADVQLIAAEGRTRSTARLSAAFETNLQAMSLLGLVVGLFLIHNTMSFSVLQRRELVTTLRLLGVTRGEILREILLEAFVLGVLGGVLGLVLGIGAAEWLIDRVTRTLNDVYFVLTVKALIISPSALLQAAGLGLLTALIGAWLPARYAAGMHPLRTHARSHLEEGSRRMAIWAAVLGAVGAALAFPMLFAFEPGLVRAIAGLFLLLGGCALMTPAWVALAGWPMQRIGSCVFRLAIGNVTRSLSRTGLAVAALSLAFAVALGIEVMTDSFRVTVDDWLGQLIQSDLYLTVPDGDVRGLDPVIMSSLRTVCGVIGVSSARRVEVVESSHGAVSLLGMQPSTQSHPGYRLKGGNGDRVWARFFEGEVVLVSEPFAARYDVRVGDLLRLATAGGWREFAVAGVVYDYRSDRGIVLISRSAYVKYWRDERLTSVGLVLAPGTDLSQVRRTVQTLLGDAAAGQVQIRSNMEIRDASLVIFDRTFAVTGVLRLLAAGVALVGMVGSLLSLHLERLREFATLRSLGLTPRQLNAVVMLQSGYIGLCAGLIALPLGLLVAWVLVKAIQTLSFGWSMDLTIPAAALWRTPAIAVAAALLAGLYPAWRAGRSTPLAALRDE